MYSLPASLLKLQPSLMCAECLLKPDIPRSQIYISVCLFIDMESNPCLKVLVCYGNFCHNKMEIYAVAEHFSL